MIITQTRLRKECGIGKWTCLHLPFWVAFFAFCLYTFSIQDTLLSISGLPFPLTAMGLSNRLLSCNCICISNYHYCWDGLVAQYTSIIAYNFSIIFLALSSHIATFVAISVHTFIIPRMSTHF